GGRAGAGGWGAGEGRLQGRVGVVTGASSGMGRATAHARGRLGAAVGLVCRDRARGEALLVEVRAASGHDRVSLFVADLSSQEAVRGMAGALRAAYPALHVLVNNAGVVNLRYAETADGIETVFAVNHLAPFLLNASPPRPARRERPRPHRERRLRRPSLGPDRLRR